MAEPNSPPDDLKAIRIAAFLWQRRAHFIAGFNDTISDNPGHADALAAIWGQFDASLALLIDRLPLPDTEVDAAWRNAVGEALMQVGTLEASAN